jgi:hypothetical protein
MIVLSPSEISAFLTDANAHIQRSHDIAWNYIKKAHLLRSQWEARFVYQLCESMPNLAAAWRRHIRAKDPSLRLNLSTVFTHQSPRAEWSRGYCELADLLIAIIDHTRAPSTGYAMLLQAKQADSHPLILTEDREKKQFDLLSRRPVFDIRRSNAPKAIDLSGYASDSALVYATSPPDNEKANPPPWCAPRWQVATGLAKLAGKYSVLPNETMAETMVEQLQSKRGWLFSLPPSKSGWKHFTSSSETLVFAHQLPTGGNIRNMFAEQFRWHNPR